MLSYTGHPFVDIGIATIAAFANKEMPEELSLSDLDAVADYLEDCYTNQPMTSFLSVVFPNSGFTQPAYRKNPEKRRLYAKKVLRAYRPESPKSETTRCIFTGEPATAVSLALEDKLPPGLCYRQHIPLITGEEIINYHPGGIAGIPVSGKALLALHAFPLGCVKAGGRLLAVHASDNNVTLRFAKAFLRANKRIILNARLAGQSKLPEPGQRFATLLIKQLIDIEEERQEMAQLGSPTSITAYHFTNSGQGADLQIYHLPLEIFDFIATALTAEYRLDWKRICERGWQLSPRKKNMKEAPVPAYNVLYEDLLRLPAQAARFIRLYFLRRPFASKLKGDPRANYSIYTDAELISWRLTELFLRKVVSMEEARISEIRNLGDSLAEHIHTDNDKRLFNSLLTAQRYDQLRSALIRANVARLRTGKAPLLRLEPYMIVFEQGEGLPYTDWRLARDLVLIRVVEKLYVLGWLQANATELKEYQESVESAE